MAMTVPWYAAQASQGASVGAVPTCNLSHRGQQLLGRRGQKVLWSLPLHGDAPLLQQDGSRIGHLAQRRGDFLQCSCPANNLCLPRSLHSGTWPSRVVTHSLQSMQRCTGSAPDVRSLESLHFGPRPLSRAYTWSISQLLRPCTKPHNTKQLIDAAPAESCPGPS